MRCGPFVFNRANSPSTSIFSLTVVTCQSTDPIARCSSSRIRVFMILRRSENKHPSTPASETTSMIRVCIKRYFHAGILVAPSRPSAGVKQAIRSSYRRRFAKIFTQLVFEIGNRIVAAAKHISRHKLPTLPLIPQPNVRRAVPRQMCSKKPEHAAMSRNADFFAGFAQRTLLRGFGIFPPPARQIQIIRPWNMVMPIPSQHNQIIPEKQCHFGSVKIHGHTLWHRYDRQAQIIISDSGLRQCLPCAVTA
ncbi:hypothetical protein GQR58_000195 [Nymphon striatum]|nr:hypothetical protein GQR58_000195 [Nymphon striatum]